MAVISLSCSMLRLLYLLLLILLPLLVVSQECLGTLDEIRNAIDTNAAAGPPTADDDIPVYIICPNSQIVFGSESLYPRYASEFRCGQSGKSSDNCQFVGGSNQVVVDDSGYSVTFAGITFSGFSISLLSGTADATTQVSFVDVVVASVTSARIVIQQSTTSSEPFAVTFQDSTFRSITSDIMLFNTNGVLRLHNVVFSDCDTSTIVLGSEIGSVSIDGMQVTGGSVILGISIGTGTSLQLENLQVRNIDDITSTFLSVSGETTTNVTIENLSLVDNERIPDSSEWNGIRVFDGASVKIFNYRLLDTVSMYSALQVDNAASASVNGLQATSVSGAVSPVNPASSLVMIEGGSSANIQQLVVDGISNFAVSVFVNEGSTARVSESCLNSGSNVQGAMFVGQDSFSLVSNNYIDNTRYLSLSNEAACPAPNPRLIKENMGSQCFVPDSTGCETTCRTFADSDECLAVTTTNAPTSAPANGGGNDGSTPTTPGGDDSGSPPTDAGSSSSSSSLVATLPFSCVLLLLGSSSLLLLLVVL